ncbi:hypothetical protein LRH25_15910, partial [Ideonella azotifigens]|nr:hypothetical protein [Ideonella azotifigens]
MKKTNRILFFMAFFAFCPQVLAYSRMEILKANVWYKDYTGSTNFFDREKAEQSSVSLISQFGNGRYVVNVLGSTPCDGGDGGNIWGEPVRKCVMDHWYDTWTDSSHDQIDTSSTLTGWYCPEGYRTGATTDGQPICTREIQTQACQRCASDRFGNPISAGDASKIQTEIDFDDPKGLLTISRDYSSKTGQFQFNFEHTFVAPGVSGRWSYWQPRGCKRGVVDNPAAEDCFKYLSEDPSYASPVGAGGVGISFVKVNDGWQSVHGEWFQRLLGPRADGSWVLTDLGTNLQKVFDASSRLVEVAPAGGGRIYPKYMSSDSGLASSIEDIYGRQLFIGRNDLNQVQNIVLPNGAVVNYSHRSTPSSGVIDPTTGSSGVVPSSVIYPDLNTKNYYWNEPEHVSGDWYRAPSANLLTGVVDEDGKRFATYKYIDSRAADTFHGDGVERWKIDDPRNLDMGLSGVVHVNSPLNSNIDITFNNDGLPVSRTQPGGSGCAAADSQLVYDANSNIVNRLDFSGKRSCMAYDTSRNLETVRVEGLGTSDTCPTDVAAYSVPVGLPADMPQRKITTQWHPLWNLKTRMAEPGKITTLVYNGVQDPILGGTPVCAPDAPLLPDGSKIAVVCRRYEHTTADALGNLGFNAALGEKRKWSYTYNQYGQALTETDPRGKATTYEYWDATSFTGEGAAARGHTLGDLKTVT